MAIEVVGGGHVLPEERPDAIAAGVLAMRDGYGGEQYASSDPLSDWSRPVTVVIGPSVTANGEASLGEGRRAVVCGKGV
jgi:hypothetical protein